MSAAAVTASVTGGFAFALRGLPGALSPMGALRLRGLMGGGVLLGPLQDLAGDGVQLAAAPLLSDGKAHPVGDGAVLQLDEVRLLPIILIP